ncbi:hypothetical protein [Neosynechococcus sphagnicola]|nr:hypothetical protein [Neosynechococcus sphagnicola]
MDQEISLSNLEKVQQLKINPELSSIHAQVILNLMRQILQINANEPFDTIFQAFESGDYGYFRLAFRRDTGDSDEENSLWLEFVKVRHDSQFKPQLINVMDHLGVTPNP